MLFSFPAQQMLIYGLILLNLGTEEVCWLSSHYNLPWSSQEIDGWLKLQEWRKSYPWCFPWEWEYPWMIHKPLWVQAFDEVCVCFNDLSLSLSPPVRTLSVSVIKLTDSCCESSTDQQDETQGIRGWGEDMFHQSDCIRVWQICTYMYMHMHTHTKIV